MCRIIAKRRALLYGAPASLFQLNQKGLGKGLKDSTSALNVPPEHSQALNHHLLGAMKAFP